MAKQRARTRDVLHKGVLIERPCFMVVINVERDDCDLEAIQALLMQGLKEQFRGTEAEDFAVALVPSRLEMLGLK